ncbi:MAG TPA: hypothetical protein VG168_08855 [Bryobacteraceae bacterium]|nr:hypothetical protein [Bryobacteraceae bacterium]
MKTTPVTHPSEDLLEKFARNGCGDDELEVVEAHILGCEICVTRLEELDDFLSAFQPAYQEVQRSRSRSVPRFSFQWMLGLATAAVLGICLSFLPRFSHRAERTILPAAQLQLFAERGNEAVSAPASRPLQVRLSATDLPQRILSVDLVNAVGSPVWHGSTQVTHDKATVNLPPMQAGAYFLRLSSGPKDHSELLREFAFQIK